MGETHYAQASSPIKQQKKQVWVSESRRNLIDQEEGVEDPYNCPGANASKVTFGVTEAGDSMTQTAQDWIKSDAIVPAQNKGGLTIPSGDQIISREESEISTAQFKSKHHLEPDALKNQG